MTGKELWFAEMERLLGEKEAAGIPEDRAYDEASNEAGPALAERLADMADMERKRRKEEGR
jgi:hypothetical protein